MGYQLIIEFNDQSLLGATTTMPMAMPSMSRPMSSMSMTMPSMSMPTMEKGGLAFRSQSTLPTVVALAVTHGILASPTNYFNAIPTLESMSMTKRMNTEGPLTNNALRTKTTAPTGASKTLGSSPPTFTGDQKNDSVLERSTANPLPANLTGLSPLILGLLLMFL